ncbi:type II secretion system protein GspD [Burkholderia cepacia]|uniref:Pilus assembly protein PilN n=2 Tax=Burkholderia cepacia complex TaxID=87882 RepID=A0AAX2RB75_BURCE|nr:pilus assembly protein PilN [Burkholderia cepacia]TES96137.1 pilus assembly protein PilN [Burkholderia cepacia]TEU32678.1 pilus assembly protein PilN [Burkholderia cepacia]TEU33497.1 pilus assembly protein PilN [Burkholderia cepacia]TEU90421.1 pilus assembly protein PilN [Burkholderia cepacia]TEU99555.1 pilus assembly protein PilN [Burkholderia cepacia]
MKMSQITLGVLVAVALAGCAIRDVRNEQLQDVQTARDQANNVNPSRPIVRTHASNWLRGEEIAASKPQPAIFDKPIRYSYQAGSLSDLAARFTKQTGIPAIVDSSATDAAVPTLPVASPAARLPLGVPGAAGGPLPPGGFNELARGGAALPAGVPGAGAWPSTSAPSYLVYDGYVRGFLDVVNSHYGVWSAYKDGVITFFRSETRVFALPGLNEGGRLEGSISTGNGDSAGGSVSGGSSVGTSSGGNSASSQKLTMTADINPWKNLQTTAKAISGGGQVVADPDAGILTVTGTPPMCDRVEAWIKTLNATYAKRIEIDVHVYEVRLSREDNYGLDLALAYKSKSGHTSVGISGASVPKIQGTATPFTFGANILSGPFSGTKGAIQALSSLGDVTTVLSKAGVTQNGKLMSLQDARQQGYVPQTQSTLASNVGSTTSMQSATLTTGFTSGFLPKLVNGNILIDFNLTLSQLIDMQTFPPGCTAGQSCVQTPTTQNTQLQQSVTLKPGDTLVLTGMQQKTLSTAGNGVGSPWVPLLGGGADAQKNDTVIAIVLSARLL